LQICEKLSETKDEKIIGVKLCINKGWGGEGAQQYKTFKDLFLKTRFIRIFFVQKILTFTQYCLHLLLIYCQ